MNRLDVLVLGGGPAGMMAAIAAAENGAAVGLLEPNTRLGKKLNITGKGRCNLTNNCDVQELMKNVPQNGRFLYSAFSQYDSQDVMAFFEALGVPLKTERGNRVFPVSDRSFDISGALERHLRTLQVRWLHDRGTALLLRDGAVTGVRGEQGTYEAPCVVIATGGVSLSSHRQHRGRLSSGQICGAYGGAAPAIPHPAGGAGGDLCRDAGPQPSECGPHRL